MKQALRPNNFSEFASLEALKPIEKEETIELDPETLALHAMSQHKGWKIFEERVQRAKDELDEMVTQQMEAGANYEAIGQSTVAKEITKDVLKQLIRFVGDARDSVESRRPTAGGDEKPGEAGL